MLVRVGMGQVRFQTPGLSVDGRGVAVGRQLVARFASFDRMVSFLRLWTGEQALDDVGPGLRLVQARAATGLREALVMMPVASTPFADAVARLARTAGGQCYTGAGKHFVQYRDSRAPLGYDAAALETADQTAEVILYGEEQTLPYTVMTELPLDKLILRLDLQRQADGREPLRDVLYLAVRRGLGPLVIEYLHRARRSSPALRVSAGMCESPEAGAFRGGTTFWLFRLEDVPRRLLGLLSATPGLTLLAPVAENVAIAVGYRHPLHLDACKQVLSPQRFYLFAPRPLGVTVLDPAPMLSPVADLVRLQGTGHGVGPRMGPGMGPRVGPHAGQNLPGDDAPAFTPARAVRGFALEVPLRLQASAAGAARAIATLIPWERVAWLRALVYALPPSALRGYRLAMLERGLLVLAREALDGIPFGQLFYAPTPDLLLPLGWELRPPVAPEELAARVGVAGGAVVVFPGPGEAPFRIAPDAIEPLQARVLADQRLRSLANLSSLAVPAGGAGDADAERPIEIENEPLGPMPLWRLGR